MGQPYSEKRRLGNKRREGKAKRKGREGKEEKKGRAGKGEGKGRDGKGEGKRRQRGREGKGREGKEEGKGRQRGREGKEKGKGREGKDFLNPVYVLPRVFIVLKVALLMLLSGHFFSPNLSVVSHKEGLFKKRIAQVI
jgi:hypothetical protein